MRRGIFRSRAAGAGAALVLASALMLAAAALAVSALPAIAAERPLTPDDVLRLEDLGQVALSPDGEWIAYTVKRAKTVSFHKWDYLNGDDRADVWLVPSAGGTPRRVTDGVTDGAGFWMPTWSPDGSRIAMLSSRGDNVYLWVWDRATGALRKLTERAVDTIGLGDRGPAWVSSRELFCPVLPEGERPLMMAVEIQVAEKAPRAWERAARGDAVTASVLETGTAQDFSKRPVQELLRIDTTDGTAKGVAKAAAFNDLRLAPGSRTLAYLGQNGVMNPDPGSLLEPRNHWVFGAATLPAGGGTPTAAAGIEDVLTGSLAWAPDGSRFAVVARAPGATSGKPRVFTCRAAGPCEDVSGDGIDPTPAMFDTAKLRWSSRNELVAAARTLKPAKPELKERRDWWLLAKGAPPRNLTASFEAPPGDLFPDTDGRMLGAADGDVWQIDPRGAASAKNLTPEFEAKIAAIAWPADGGRENPSGSVVFGVQNGVHMDLHAFEPGSRKTRALVKPLPAASLAAYDPRGEVAVWKASDRNGLFLWTARGAGAASQVLHANAFLKDVAEAQSRQIDYRGLDGQDLKAWLLLPVGYEEGKKYPMVTWVYAGSMAGEKPSILADLGFAHALNLQLLAARGYAVLMPSMPLPPDGPPGADPYMELTKGVLPAVDKAVDLGFADPKRLGVMGQSFGGFSTMGLITQTSRFQAAVALAGLSNLVSLYGQFDPRMRYDDYPHENLFYMFLAESGQENLGNTLAQNFARYVRNSPLFYADRVQTPLMIIQGDMDYVTMSQGEEFFMSLHRQGKRASFVRYWGEGHVLEGPANVRDMWERIDGWFDEYLKAPPPEKTPEKEKP